MCIRDRLQGLQPTYEELKHNGAAVCGKVTLGLQPTYEELKQKLLQEVRA